MDFASLALQEGPVCCEGSVVGMETAEVRRVLSANHPDRPSLERFIADAYLCTYGATIRHFAHQLVGLRRPEGPWLAGVGYTLAGRDPLFVEQYLERSVEAEMSARLGVSIRRDQLVEVGNLAASGAGVARRIIICTTALLHQLGRTWVVFTSTKSLLNSFGRLDIAPILLARADPSRLPDHGRSWGSYYDTNPQVMAANIPMGYLHLLPHLAPRPAFDAAS